MTETKVRISQTDFAGRSDDWLAGYEAGSLAGIQAERERCAKLVDDFSWTLPMFGDAALNEVSDDAAEMVKEQIAASIRATQT